MKRDAGQKKHKGTIKSNKRSIVQTESPSLKISSPKKARKFEPRPSLSELSQDPITIIAQENWLGENCPPFSSNLAQQLYNEHIRGSEFHASSLSTIEYSQYLERYLWPNFSFEREIVFSVLALVNEKIRQNINPWEYLSQEEEKFALLIRSTCEAHKNYVLSTPEKIVRVRFIINVFTNLDVDIIRKTCMPVVSLPMWTSLSPGRLDFELKHNPLLAKKFNGFLKKKSKLKSNSNESSFREAFIPDLIREYKQIFDKAVAFDDSSNNVKDIEVLVTYMSTFLEMCIDLLSQIPTRKFFRPILDEFQLTVLIRNKILGTSTSITGTPFFSTFLKQVDILDYYLAFEMDDRTGETLSKDEIIAKHCERLQRLQIEAYRLFPDKLRSLAIANHSSIEKANALVSQLKHLNVDECDRLALALNCLPKTNHSDTKDQQTNEGQSLALDSILIKFCAKPTQIESFKNDPLFPDEKELWNDAYTGKTKADLITSLALPKLNLQFLTFHDYLLRNYTLYRLESMFSIRQDLEDDIRRCKPRLRETNNIVFDGWAKMAVPIRKFAVSKVGPPSLDSVAPSSVEAEVEYDIGKLPIAVQKEWSQTREHDVMFLVKFDYPLDGYDSNSSSISFKESFGIQSVRGIEVKAPLDIEGKEVREWDMAKAVFAPEGSGVRRIRCYLDPLQYYQDSQKGEDKVDSAVFHLIIRRNAKENNFKAILETIRDLMISASGITKSSAFKSTIPPWLYDIFLGYGDPGAAAFYNMANLNEEDHILDFGDTFTSKSHLISAFPDAQIVVDEHNVRPKNMDRPFYKLRLKNESSFATLEVIAYDPPTSLMTTQKDWRERSGRNPVSFTPRQVEAIRSGMEPGLSLIVGPPGTGKTDVAVQIITNLYRSNPRDRILVLTHSNDALNDIFEKIMQRDGIDELNLLRLGQGERLLETEKSFSKIGRVNFVLKTRLDGLKEVEKLARILNIEGDYGYTCETAAIFYKLYILPKWEAFVDQVKNCPDELKAGVIRDKFPFTRYFVDSTENSAAGLFFGESGYEDETIAWNLFERVKEIFTALDACRSFEILRNNRERANYLMLKQAKIVAMTCTHAAMRRKDFLELGLQYGSVIMEESGQVLEIETIIPLLLQKNSASLKRVVLIGDHNQLPPIIKNSALQKFSKMNQSLFARMIRLGNPYIELDMQGRARPEIVDLYRYRYKSLKDLTIITDGSKKEYKGANPGFVHNFQVVDIGDSCSETQPVPHFYQNLAEAEYIAAFYQYMRLIGYPADKITVLTTYNGQKHLLRDVISARVSWNSELGMPLKITTVDKYQGQQNDYILLSLVRTKHIGHLRDVRRLTVALSRARLGLYIFCRASLFANCVELATSFGLLLQRPLNPMLLTGEKYGDFRSIDEEIDSSRIKQVTNATEMGQIVDQLVLK